MNYKLIARRLRAMADEVEGAGDPSSAQTETNEEYLSRIAAEMDGQPIPGTDGVHLDFEHRDCHGNPVDHPGQIRIYTTITDPQVLMAARRSLSQLPESCPLRVYGLAEDIQAGFSPEEAQGTLSACSPHAALTSPPSTRTALSS